MRTQKTINFKDLKNKIDIDALAKKSGITEPVYLLNYIVNMQCNKKKTGTFIIGGAYIPQIVLVGDSGRLYYFSLYSVLDN